MAKFVIYTDGASRGNPGNAAAAFVIRDNNNRVLAKSGAYLGIATNNHAEYSAVKLALQALVDEFAAGLPAEVEVRADSMLVVNQLVGKFKIKNPQLQVFVGEVKKLEQKIGRVNYTYIPRIQNFQADGIANQTLDREADGR